MLRERLPGQAEPSQVRPTDVLALTWDASRMLVLLYTVAQLVARLPLGTSRRVGSSLGVCCDLWFCSPERLSDTRQVCRRLPRPGYPPLSLLTTHGLRLTCTTTHGASVTRPQSDRRPARSSSHDSSQRGGCARLTRPRPGWRLTRRPPQGRGRARAHARQRTHAGEALPPPPPAPAPELSATTRTRSETAPARR